MTRIFLVRHGEAEGNLYRRPRASLTRALTPRAGPSSSAWWNGSRERRWMPPIPAT